MNFKRVGMKLLLALVFISVLTSFLVVFLMKLLAALYIYIVGGVSFHGLRVLSCLPEVG